ncbi:MAG: endonuclease/exonuclease/phosphatase family protein [Phycisphaerales bacterium]|nr:endonuclease/exonuclease/phosphatase family protein [Phycisphaerales bacterium]
MGCRNCSCQKSEHAHAVDTQGPSVRHAQRVLIGLSVLAIAGAGIASALALTSSEQPTTATPPPTPAQSAPKPSATPGHPTAAAPLAATPGLIRHGRKDPIAKPAGAIRVATYNIENLFDVEQPGVGSGTPTPRKPDEHRKAIAAAIKAIDADVLALQEIASKEVLIKFRDEYLKDLGYTYVSSLDAGDGRQIEQSVLSRFPLKDELNWPDTKLDAVHPEKLGRRANPDAGKPIEMARSPLRVTVTAAPKDPAGKPYDLTLFVVHHKSGPFHSYQREAEAAKVLSLAKGFESEHAGANIVILGDFNAKPDEKAVQTYLTSGFMDPFGDLVERNDPSVISHVSGRVIDHVLLNSNAAGELIKETRFVLGTMQRPEGMDWRSTLPPEGYASDHYPVVIDLMPIDKPAAAPKN